jgi:hypothetical protein
MAVAEHALGRDTALALPFIIAAVSTGLLCLWGLTRLQIDA